MPDLSAVVETVLARRASHPPATALLVGLSGIDGSGKGHVARQLVEAMTERGLRVASINVDGWLNLPEIRFDPTRPGENFYENALRLDEMFERLVLPLRDTRSVNLTTDFVEETATAYRPHTYAFADLDAIVLEGAYLYKRAYRQLFDLAVWVDCSWETALERAVARAQEGLTPDETIRAYRTIFFPAEEIHFLRDEPRASADLILPNDSRLGERQPAGAMLEPTARKAAIEECFEYFRRAVRDPESVPPWSEWWAANAELVERVFGLFDYVRLKHRKLLGARQMLQLAGELPENFSPLDPADDSR